MAHAPRVMGEPGPVGCDSTVNNGASQRLQGSAWPRGDSTGESRSTSGASASARALAFVAGDLDPVAHGDLGATSG